MLLDDDIKLGKTNNTHKKNIPHSLRRIYKYLQNLEFTDKPNRDGRRQKSGFNCLQRTFSPFNRV